MCTLYIINHATLCILTIDFIRKQAYNLRVINAKKRMPKEGEIMTKPEKYKPSDFQNLYNRLSLVDRLSIDSTVQMSFLFFQRMYETVITMQQQNQNRKEK